MPSDPSPITSNQEQIDYWNGVAAERWVQNQADTDRALAPFGLAALERLAPAPGEAILDVGCGTGQTLLQLSERLGVSGRAVGVDPSRLLLARARERTSHLRNVELIEADAATHAFDGRFDGVFSRFGVMFFADPAQAFAHLRGALTPAGRLSFVCWQELEKNPWLSVPLAAARAVLNDEAPVGDPDAPGPFAFARPDRVRGVLSSAGYRNIVIEPFQERVRMAEAGIEAAVTFALRIGPVARLLAEQPESVRSKVRARVGDHLSPFARGNHVELDGVAWVVSARA